MPPVLTRWLPLALLALLAFGVRVWDLDRRPMHADEANQAVKAGELLEHGRYAFDPVDHHGPTLYYSVLPIAWLRGESTLAELTETTVRLVPALAGVASVLLLFLLARPLGHWPALAAAAFLALSPPAAYYSRYFVQETLLATFLLGALVCAQRWWVTGRLAWAVGAGLCAGLMQATKASTPLLVLAVLGGLVIARPRRPVSTNVLRDLACAGLAALILAALFYSSFGTHPRGLVDALLTYPAMTARLGLGTGHEKPWWYYLGLFGWQKVGGLTTHQLAFSTLALAGLIFAFTPRASHLLRWAAGSGALLLIILSASAYKTPWHALHVVPFLSLLAAGAFAALPQRPTSRFLAVGLALAALYSQAQQVRLTSFLRPADERNPYAYVHTSPDVRKVRTLVTAAQAARPDRPVRVISEEAWPLPWYLRGLTGIGYWSTVPAACDGALVITSAGLADEVRSHLTGDYDTTFVGLRPGFVLVVFTPRS
ncbi:hypothetical protein Verru16b_03292 [Lacunisphaera limnophila]|uniref:Glycosyltransferase RgtA/B/C/D-like domain-containing protein n=1 Tax=Lacunisphaera limnophila TaxID=1838286 RepID=A0A1D8AZ88_9BACT|nr:flippase activity-associated protein Agl23 [Lacunisphaera limnophila]AOS46195.1 hypothetical protein Verru16b_03292 [Lacunisphaera limnophila]